MQLTMREFPWHSFWGKGQPQGVAPTGWVSEFLGFGMGFVVARGPSAAVGMMGVV
jgi:hypothetical protein